METTSYWSVFPPSSVSLPVSLLNNTEITAVRLAAGVARAALLVAVVAGVAVVVVVTGALVLVVFGLVLGCVGGLGPVLLVVVLVRRPALLLDRAKQHWSHPGLSCSQRFRRE